MKNLLNTLNKTKTAFIIGSLLLISNIDIQAQNKNGVSIGTDAAPNANAILDLKGDKQGILFPKVSSIDDMPNLGAAEKGLVIYSEEMKNIYYWNGQEWRAVGGELDLERPTKPIRELKANENGQLNEFKLSTGNGKIDMLDFVYMQNPEVQIPVNTVPLNKLKPFVDPTGSVIQKAILVSEAGNISWKLKIPISSISTVTTSPTTTSYLISENGVVKWKSRDVADSDIRELIEKIRLLENRIEALENE